MNDSNHLVGGGEAAALVALADDGTPTTTSVVVAMGAQMDHASVIKLVRTHLADFNEFSPIGFEIQKGRPLPQGGFARSTEYAVLTEEHATLLITYLRNSDVVRAFKKRLVAEFFAMRRALTTPAAPALTDDELIHQALVVSTKRTREMAELAGRLATKVAEQTQVYTRPDGQVVPTATTYVLPTGVEFLRRKLAGQDVAEQPVTVAALPLAEAK